MSLPKTKWDDDFYTEYPKPEGWYWMKPEESLSESSLFKSYGSSPEEYQKQLEKDYQKLSDISKEEYEAAQAYEADAWLFNEI